MLSCNSALLSLAGLGLVSAGSEIIASGPSTKIVMDEGTPTQATLTANTLNGTFIFCVLNSRFLFDVDLFYLFFSGLLRTKKPLTVHGTSDTFYPVWFGDECWIDMGTTITIDRADVHTGGTWKGSMHLEFKFHSQGGGHGSDYWYLEATLQI